MSGRVDIEGNFSSPHYKRRGSLEEAAARAVRTAKPDTASVWRGCQLADR
ncbi:MAG: hypothetical protein IIB40_04480 [Candidatus Marinimicrobia bacterium]|nr:hypothetical protein [Candidatus Neomarinimicrobiota bacterium]